MGCSGSKVSEVGDKTKVIFVIGGPGCGKGIQCEKLGEEFNYVHMPIRDVLKSIVLHNMGDDWETLLNDIKEKKSIYSFHSYIYYSNTYSHQFFRIKRYYNTTTLFYFYLLHFYHNPFLPKKR